MIFVIVRAKVPFPHHYTSLIYMTINHLSYPYTASELKIYSLCFLNELRLILMI
jgi:hypothetical protein